MDYHSTDLSGNEMVQLIHFICRSYSGDAQPPLLMFEYFPTNANESGWFGKFRHRVKEAKHYFHLPKELAGAKMLNFVAEGDVGS